MSVQANRLATHLARENIEVIPVAVRGHPSWMDNFPLLRTFHHFMWRLRKLNEIAPAIDGVIVFSCTGRYFDLVTLPVVKYCARRKIPVVLSDRGGDTETWLSSSPRIRRQFRSIALTCRNVHVSSQYLKRVFARYEIETAAVPIFVEPPKYLYRPRAAKPGLIVNNRTMSRFHGVQLLIRVFAELASQHPNSSLVITGAGVDAAACRRLAATLHLQDRVRFAGVLAEEEMAHLLAEADLVVNTSTHDNMPNAILEAFAAGVPVISSAVGGIPESIGCDERGYLVRDRSVAGFLSAVERCIHNPDGTLARAERAKRWVDSLTWETLRQDYLRVLVEPFAAGKTEYEALTR